MVTRLEYQREVIADAELDRALKARGAANWTLCATRTVYQYEWIPTHLYSEVTGKPYMTQVSKPVTEYIFCREVR